MSILTYDDIGGVCRISHGGTGENLRSFRRRGVEDCLDDAGHGPVSEFPGELQIARRDLQVNIRSPRPSQRVTKQAVQPS